MPETPKSLMLRAVLVGVSPIVARVLSVPDSLTLEELHEVMLLLLEWESHHFYSFRVHGQEISRRVRLRRRRLNEFDLRWREKFLYTYSALDLWEWEFRVLDVTAATGEDAWPRCLAGRRAAPPEDIGGPQAYMQFLDQERYYLPVAVPGLADLALERMASVLPKPEDRELLKDALQLGMERSAERLAKHADFEPDRFSLLRQGGAQARLLRGDRRQSVLAFRRADQVEKPSSKCFSLVQTFDQKPRRRLWELLKSQGMQESQQVVLHPASEHWLDWFHVTMRLTVLLQQAKGLQDEAPGLGDEVTRDLTAAKHFLWHGNTFQALR